MNLEAVLPKKVRYIVDDPSSRVYSVSRGKIPKCVDRGRRSGGKLLCSAS